MDNPADRVVHLRVVLLPHPPESLLGHDEVEPEIGAEVDSTRISELGSLIRVVGRTRICGNEEADVIFGAGHDAKLALERGSLQLFTFRRFLVGHSWVSWWFYG